MNTDNSLYSLLVLRGLQGVSRHLPFPFHVLSHNFGTSCQTCVYCYVNLIVKVMYIYHKCIPNICQLIF